MSQNSLIIADGNGAAVLAAINAALDTLKTVNAGVAAPSTPSAFMVWADLTNGKMKQRNAANTAWITLWDLTSGQMGNTSGVLQIVSSNPATTSGNSYIASQGTLPTITSGNQVASLNITPSAISSKVRISLCAQIPPVTTTDSSGSTVTVPGVLAFFRGSICIASFMNPQTDNFIIDTPGSTDILTYSARYMNINSPATWYFNRIAGASGNPQGGSWKASYTLEEIAG